MLVYRIIQKRYDQELKASGRENRWNTEGRFVIYCASSLSLACLEVVVHTSGKSLINQNFSSLTIKIPDDISATVIDLKNLPEKWKQIEQLPLTQQIGDEWYNKQDTLLMQVPSAIITKEVNYLINTKHPDFDKVSIAEVDSFSFDDRIKS